MVEHDQKVKYCPLYNFSAPYEGKMGVNEQKFDFGSLLILTCDGQVELSVCPSSAIG